jgi:hypothetical protein
MDTQKHEPDHATLRTADGQATCHVLLKPAPSDSGSGYMIEITDLHPTRAQAKWRVEIDRIGFEPGA